MKGKDLKNKIVKIELLDGVHECVYDMNAVAEIEEIYGNLQAGIDQFSKKPYDAVRSFIYALLKADNDDLTIKGAGKLIPLGNIAEIIVKITEALNDGTPEDETSDIEEEEEKENPNV